MTDKKTPTTPPPPPADDRDVVFNESTRDAPAFEVSDTLEVPDKPAPQDDGGDSS